MDTFNSSLKDTSAREKLTFFNHVIFQFLIKGYIPHTQEEQVKKSDTFLSIPH